MKSTILFIVALSVLAFSCKKSPPEVQVESEYNEKESIKELSQKVHEIWQDAENKDIEKLKSAHYESPKFSKFGPRVSERQNVSETNRSETEHFSKIKDVKLILENLKVDVFENIGIATFYNNYSFIKNGEIKKGKVRVTLAFIKSPDGWKIIHEHSSPFNE